jgi:aspartyl-tRNA(Asn)/glutamyl-tRNA(Gln) amidotransferase subunit A
VLITVQQNEPETIIVTAVQTATDPRTGVRCSLEAIGELDDRLRACIVVRGEAAWQEACALVERQPSGPLYGWTVAVKDNMDVAGTIRSDGLRPAHGPAAARDSEAVRRLRVAGAVVVAKTNLEELSFGATTQNAWWGKCRNPWDPDRLPGGSSGGSAVAVAAGMVDAALGSDTGGSIRNPAAFCGISALRPSIGWVPTAGVTPLSPDLDVVGPMARSVEQLRVLLSVLAQRAAPPQQPEPLRVLRIGIPESFFYDELHPLVGVGCERLLAVLEEGGSRLRRLSLSGAEETPEALSLLLNAQAAELHGALLSDERLDPQVRDRLLLGRAATAQQRRAARGVAARWQREIGEAFEGVDLLLVPTTPMPAPPIDGTHLVGVSRQINRLNCAWSLARLPALAIPCAADTLPVGAQLVGPHGSDWKLLEAGAAVQRLTDWHERRPPLLASLEPTVR